MLWAQNRSRGDAPLAQWGLCCLQGGGEFPALRFWGKNTLCSSWRLVPQFPWVYMHRLLASQLREEKQQHEEEVEGLHLDICSLKQLSQQQAALIQDLQRHQGQDGLQTHVLRLKEENWVRRANWDRQDWAWGCILPCVLW